MPPALRALGPLALLLELNRRCAAAEGEKRSIAGPGLPAFCDGDERFVSDDCLRMPGMIAPPQGGAANPARARSTYRFGCEGVRSLLSMHLSKVIVRNVYRIGTVFMIIARGATCPP